MDERIVKATAGDNDALGQLLFERHDVLAAFIRAKIPADLRGSVDADDIVQQTYIDAFRDISGFRPKSDGAFFRWLETIAEHRFLDMVRAHRRKKRGGDRRRIDNANVGHASTIGDLFDVISTDLPTPSRNVAREEGIRELRVQLAQLPEDYRTAIRLRDLQGLDLEQVAEEMNRPVDAVRGLLYRGRKKLRGAMGKSSLWLSKK